MSFDLQLEQHLVGVVEELLDEADMGPQKPKYKVRAAFGGKMLSQHTSQSDAHKAAAKHSHKEPVHIWTNKGGSFGMGKVVAHYNDGQRTVYGKGKKKK